MADISKITVLDGTTYDIKDATARTLLNGHSVGKDVPADAVFTDTTLTLLSYGNSTWNDFITAYNNNAIVYCRASSNNNPATGSQTRLAFMAYVNNATNPTEVEFQYYRSVTTHTDSQQGDQVYVYKLNKTNGWSVTVRSAFSKVVAGTGLSSSYSSGTITLNNTLTIPPKVSVTDSEPSTPSSGDIWFKVST